jgi:ankyrin repeat protein
MLILAWLLWSDVTPFPIVIYYSSQSPMANQSASEVNLDIHDDFEYTPESSLHTAAGHGDTEEVSRLLDAGSDVNALDYAECTPLHRAIGADSEEVVHLLLTHGADPSLKCLAGSDGLEGDDAALSAARLNAIAAMRELIQNGVSVHSYALAFATSGENIEMIKVLLEEHTADFSNMSRQQAIQSALSIATNTCNIGIVRYLLDKLQFSAGGTDHERQLVLDAALLAIFDQEDVHDGFVDPYPERDWRSALYILSFLIDAGAQVNAHEDEIPRTPLHFALQARTLPTELIEYLLAHGADVNIPNWIGRTPYFNLLIHPNGTMDLVNLFKIAGGSLDTVDFDSNVPLHLVRIPEIARMLLYLGANPNAKNKEGETPLHVASRYGRLEILNLLLEAGADTNHRTKAGWTPLMFSSQQDISDALLQYGANVNAATDLGWTALHVASDTNNGPLAAFLLTKGADLHALAAHEQDFWSKDLVRTTVLVRDQTPLHVAVAAKGPVMPDTVAILLNKGANIEAKDSTGRTPLLVAIATDGNFAPNEGIVNCLLRQRANTQVEDHAGRNAIQLAEARRYTINETGRFERIPVEWIPVPQPSYGLRGILHKDLERRQG